MPKILTNLDHPPIVKMDSCFPCQQSCPALTTCSPLCVLTIICRFWRWCDYVHRRLPHLSSLPSFPPFKRERVSSSQPLVIMMSFLGRRDVSRWVRNLLFTLTQGYFGKEKVESIFHWMTQEPINIQQQKKQLLWHLRLYLSVATLPTAL